jgi:SAM-dependent methyltransferase
MASMPDRATRARSFGAIADDYDRYRPGPPVEGARWVLGQGRTSVLDLGAGTGGLTRSLVQLASRVTAVEPDARMRDVLARRSGGAAVVGAVGERLPFVTGSADGVIASSAWHWMDPALAGAEVARVLAEGGVFGLLWSGPDRSVPWVADLLGRRRDWPGRAGEDPSEFARRRTMALPPELPFTEPETTVIRFSRTVDVDDLAGLSGTFSVVIVGGGREREARIEAVRERARANPAVGEGPIELPMACRCWRAFRTGGPPGAS